MKNNFLIYMLLNIFLFSQDINKTIELDNYVNKKQFEKENIELNKFSINYDLLEDVIDSKRYIVGPGDIFSFNMLSADGIVNKSLIVNPTGEVLIPAIGNINVNNKTLYDAINLINKKCLLKYPNSNIHVALIKIRRFKIQVKGINDIVSYVEASQIMRVSEIMSKIYSDFNNNHKIKISERNIKIIRNDNLINVDLPAFRRFGDKSKNPTLMQGDILDLQLEENYIGIYGGIKMPGRYELSIDETLASIINLSGGFTKNADKNNIEITRFIDDINKKVLIVNQDSTLSKIYLKDEDHIIIRYKQDYKRQDLVTVNGEVKYPGVYSISHNVTTIKDLISKCGGLSSKADISKIKINNTLISLIEDYELNRISMIPNEYQSDEEKSYVKARSRSPKGNINSSDKKFTDQIMNFTLNRNDVITIPQSVDYVEILGGVYYPGRYPFYSKYSIADYVKLAGGYTNTARNKKYIVKNNNGQRIALNKKIHIENGDIIFIAEKIEFNFWERFKEIIEILGQIATLIVMVETLGS